MSFSAGADGPPFQEDITEIPEPLSALLEEYSGVPKQDQRQHILDVRNRAYKSHPYPCLGRFRFVDLELSTHPLYNDYIIPKLRAEGGETQPIFLDLGTCLGQDIRKLLFDGVPASRVYGADILPEFIDIGYELFRDEKILPRDHFLCPANVFDKSENNALNGLDGKVDILGVTAVFHLFSDDQQLEVAIRCLRLLKKESGTRCLVLGGQVGNMNGQESVRANGSRKARHNADTWRSLWEQACEQVEFRDKVKKLQVETDMTTGRVERADGEQRKQQGLVEQGFRWMVWHVWVEF